MHLLPCVLAGNFSPFRRCSKRVVRRCTRVGPLLKGLHALLPDFVLVIERKLENVTGHRPLATADFSPAPKYHVCSFPRKNIAVVFRLTSRRSIVSCTPRTHPQPSRGRTKAEGVLQAPPRLSKVVLALHVHANLAPRLEHGRAALPRTIDALGVTRARTPAFARWCTTRAHERPDAEIDSVAVVFILDILSFFLPNVR